MQPKKYETLLRGSLKPLGNFVDQALQYQTAPKILNKSI